MLVGDDRPQIDVYVVGMLFQLANDLGQLRLRTGFHKREHRCKF